MLEPAGPMGDGDTRRCPWLPREQTRTGQGWLSLSCFDWLYFQWGKRGASKGQICQKWAPMRDELFLCPSGGCRSHLNKEFRGDTILHIAKVQAMNRALLCSNKCWRNVCLSQCCWMENEIVDFWAILPEMCKAAKIQSLFGNPQPSITQAIVK